MTLRQALALAAERIDRRDADLLLAHILRRDRAFLRAHPEDSLTEAEHTAYLAAVDARHGHKPLQYITGHQEFYGLDLQLSPATLIPRPETEILVEAVLDWARSLALKPLALQPQAPHRLRIADVGTGTGAIALALAMHLGHGFRRPWQDIWIDALDLSPAVRPVVEENTRRLGLSGQVHFAESDLLAALGPQLAAGLRLDAVVSNPPYIPEGDASTLKPEVRDFEPHTALFAGPDGLAIYRQLIPQAAGALRRNGLLALEFGFGQQTAIQTLLQGWNDVCFLDDLAGIPRVALALRA